MKKLLVGTVVSLTAFASLWVALAGGTAGAAQTKHQNRTGVHVSSEPTAPDSDTLLSGDQTSPDGATAQTSSAGATASRETAGSTSSGDESGGEGERQGGEDGPGGHQDPPGTVNHECTGDCQE